MDQKTISTDKLRTVYLVTWGFADFGGMERHITELAKALRASGIAVTVFCEMPVSPGNQYRRELQAAGIPLHSPRIMRSFVLWWQKRFPAAPPRVPGSSPPSSAKAMGTSVLARLLQRKLTKHSRRDRPDVIHVHGWRLRQWVIPWCAEQRIAAVYTEHSTISECGGPDGAEAPACLAGAGDIACVSEMSRRSLTPWLPGRAIAIHRHIVQSSGHPAAAPAGGTIPLLTIARARIEKGLDVLLDALAPLKNDFDFHLTIAGDGPMLPELRTLTTTLGLDGKVTFRGALPAAQVSRELNRASIFLLPSRTEAMPFALLEAMAQGLAIIATSVGGIPEVIVDGETGLLVEPERSDALAAAIARLLAEPDTRQRLALEARRQFESGPWSVEACLNSVLASYQRARKAIAN